MRLVFIDTETNDHPSKGSALRIVSITWLIARLDGTVEKIEDYIIRPDGFRIAYGAEQVHKISESHARGHGHPIRDVLTKLVDDLKHPQGMTLICHNVRFDRDVIGHELRRHGIAFDMHSLPSIDTMKRTASICKLPKARGSGYKDPKLQELHVHLFGREFVDAHTSKADVEATARCFFELRRRGVFREIGNNVAAQTIKQEREWLEAYGEKDIGKTIRVISGADIKVIKPPQVKAVPAKQTVRVLAEPVASIKTTNKLGPVDRASLTPKRQGPERIVKPASDVVHPMSETKNTLRGWFYLIINEAMPGHVLLGYSDNDPIQHANRLNGHGAPFPYLVAYAALMADAHSAVGLFAKKYIDKKKNGKWYGIDPIEAVTTIRELCRNEILYEDVRIEINERNKQVDETPKAIGNAPLSFEQWWTIKTSVTVPERRANEVEHTLLSDMYLKNAEQGNVNAQFHLGKMYAVGGAITKNMDESVKWLNKAAEQGHSGAIQLLQDMGLKVVVATDNRKPASGPICNQFELRAVAPTDIDDPLLWEDVNIKLLLACHFLELGDKEQAYDILQEVLSEGDVEQKAMAAKLLTKAD